MKVLLDENGYISSFALAGDLVDGIEISDPEDMAHFTEYFAAYRVRDSTASFDTDYLAKLEQKQLKAEYRQRRETECFPFINRGQLWYERLSASQLKELQAWYAAWLNVTNTMVVPEKPAWL